MCIVLVLDQNSQRPRSIWQCNKYGAKNILRHESSSTCLSFPRLQMYPWKFSFIVKQILSIPMSYGSQETISFIVFHIQLDLHFIFFHISFQSLQPPNSLFCFYLAIFYPQKNKLLLTKPHCQRTPLGHLLGIYPIYCLYFIFISSSLHICLSLFGYHHISSITLLISLLLEAPYCC